MSLEIEKKFLIKYPDLSFLESLPCCEVSEIEQTYLATDTGSERVRKRVWRDRIEYTHTSKKDVGAITREEIEERITEEEYTDLLLRADPTCHTLQKRRYVVRRNGVCYEIDVYPFWSEQAVLEIELSDEKQEVLLPDFVTVLADVSCDKRYTNHRLSKNN